MQATEALSAGDLMIPLFYNRDSSLHCASEATRLKRTRRLGQCLLGDITEGPCHCDLAGGCEYAQEPGTPWCLFCRPGSIDQSGRCYCPCRACDPDDDGWPDAVHPFWVIKRQAAETDMWNAELVEQEVATVVACEFTGQVGKTAPITDTVKVTVPCIVNSKAIAAGEVVILKMAVSPQM